MQQHRWMETMVLEGAGVKAAHWSGAEATWSGPSLEVKEWPWRRRGFEQWPPQWRGRRGCAWCGLGYAARECKAGARPLATGILNSTGPSGRAIAGSVRRAPR